MVALSDLKSGSFYKKGILDSRNNMRERRRRACGIIIINGCVLLVCCRKIAEQRGPRAATGSLLPQTDFSGGFTICNKIKWTESREGRKEYVVDEGGWGEQLRGVRRSGVDTFCAKLLARRVNICIWRFERMHFYTFQRRRTIFSFSKKLDLLKNEKFN